MNTNICLQRLITIFILFFATSTFAAADMGEFTNPDKSIIVSSQNPAFTLRLKSNPATGYSWFLISYDHQLLTAENQEYVRSTSQLVGAEGYELWTFQLKPAAMNVPRVLKIVMRYARPWEVNSGDETVFTVVVTKRQVTEQRKFETR